MNDSDPDTTRRSSGWIIDLASIQSAAASIDTAINEHMISARKQQRDFVKELRDLEARKHSTLVAAFPGLPDSTIERAMRDPDFFESLLANYGTAQKFGV